MPANAPLTAAGSRDPDKQRPLEACDLMVFGRPDDEDCKPLDFIEAAKECGVAPDIMRRWLDRAQVRAYLLASRRTFREAICAGNEGALQRIRDKSPNGMAVIASVRALENLDDETATRALDPKAQPGVTIRVVTVVQQGAPAPPMIDVTPRRPAPIAPAPPPSREPVFMGGPRAEDTDE